jgi:hypothetical protein
VAWAALPGGGGACYRLGVDEPTQHARRCPRCDTPAQPGGTVCERCELPFEGPAKVRYNPAGLALPSPVQGHATVMASIAAAVILLFVGAWLALGGVGPFKGQAVGQRVIADRSSVVITVKVTNEGSRRGKARCRVTGVAPDGRLVASQVRLSPAVAPKASVEFQVADPVLVDTHDVEASCN